MEESKNPKLKKNGGPGTAVGNFLRNLKSKVAPAILDAVGVGDFARAIDLIETNPNNTLTDFEKQVSLELIKADLKDLENARNMQVEISTSENSTKMSKNFIYYLASAVFIFSAIIVLLLFFVEIPDRNKDVVNFVLGVVVGTGLVGVFSYFFGSSQGSKNKEQILNKIRKI